MNLMKRFALVILGLVALTPALAHAAPTAGAASSFIDKLGNEALSVLSTKGVTSSDGNAQFKALLNDNFDVPGIGRFVLGRFWNTATPEQQAEYQTLFKTMVEQIYIDRFSTYSGQTFKITGERAEGDKDAVVSTQIVQTNGAPNTNVDWRVRQTDGGFKIMDVIVEGVSMSVTQRSEFASVIQRNKGQIEALLKVLREKTANGQGAALSATK